MTDFDLVRRTAAVAFFTLASSLTLHAQQAMGNSVDSGAAAAAVSSAPTVSFATPIPAFHLTTEDSSSSTDGVSSSSVPALDLAATGLQPPPRRSYGRPRYNDSSHNPDGSNKYAFEGAAGLVQPVGNTYHYLTPSWGVQVGAGRNFSKQIAVMAQFDWDNFGFNKRTLGNQLSLYNYGVPTANQLGALDGNTHIWSFSINPQYNVSLGEKLGGYVIAGAGFYHKVANFTTPVQGTACDYYYGCYTYTANESIDKYSSNAPGVNGGFGITYKPSRFANEHLYAEVRYVVVFNSQRTGITINSSSAVLNTYTGSDYFPANSNRTTYIPIKVGIRF